MKKTLLGTSIVALVHAMSAVPALADDTINSQLTNGQLVAFCATAGIGTEKPAEITLPDGTTSTGTVSCDADALNAAAAGDPNALVSDDESVGDNQGDNGNTGDNGDTADNGDGDGGDNGETSDTADSGDSGDSGDDGDTSDSGDTGDAGGD